MKKNDKIALRQKSTDELQAALRETQQKLAESRVRFSNGALKDSSVFKKLRYQISLITALINQK
ncbi:50S ribosomal protein L29 [Patescibacteria group bacterium]|nr:50S ribosomal protein L29 [Patescibacteria group bacterium]